jgi:hypothetical protein
LKIEQGEKRMQKINRSNFKISPKKNVRLDFQDMDIEIKPYIDLQDEIELIRNYVDTLYKDIDSKTELEIADNFITAEYAFIIAVLDKCTNITILSDPDNESENIDINAIIGSGLWYQIREKIDNYYDVESRIMDAISAIKHRNIIVHSVGKVLETVSTQLVEVMKTLSDLDPEKFATVVKDFSDKLEDLNKTVPGILEK